MKTFINGYNYSWSSITVSINSDAPITGITAISYEDSQVKENHYGAGNMPIFRGRGKYEAKASITLYSDEVEKILASNKDIKGLHDIAPFNIAIAFLDGDNKIANHVIRNCEFTNNKREMKQGDTKTEVQLDLIVSHIEWS